MKHLIIIVLAVFMLGLAVPRQSEANGAWVPAAIVGGIIMGAVIAEATHPHHVYAYGVPRPSHVYCSPRPGCVYPRYVNRSHYRHVAQRKLGHWCDRRQSIPHHHRQDRRHR